MSICPLCNGLQTICQNCQRCSAELEDKGKITDYLDTYSAYEDIETLKQVDGNEHSIENKICVHYFLCEQCGFEEYVEILE
ncbi:MULTISPECIES: hypothetical protein [Bacillus]|uniref:hypothetical protein n=1 Tax=Bacillus TaxID=1386 RepID=UPI0002EB99DF|nr:MULTISPECIES: hypothetical protein [Bacillus]